MQDWQAGMPGAYDEKTTLINRGRTANTTHYAETQRLSQRRRSSRPLHLQGTFGVSTNRSVSSTSSFDWEKDGESVLEESIIAAAERDGMCDNVYPLSS